MHRVLRASLNEDKMSDQTIYPSPFNMTNPARMLRRNGSQSLKDDGFSRGPHMDTHPKGRHDTAAFLPRPVRGEACPKGPSPQASSGHPDEAAQRSGSRGRGLVGSNTESTTSAFKGGRWAAVIWKMPEAKYRIRRQK